MDPGQEVVEKVTSLLRGSTFPTPNSDMSKSLKALLRTLRLLLASEQLETKPELVLG